MNRRKFWVCTGFALFGLQTGIQDLGQGDPSPKIRSLKPWGEKTVFWGLHKMKSVLVSGPPSSPTRTRALAMEKQSKRKLKSQSNVWRQHSVSADKQTQWFKHRALYQSNFFPFPSPFSVSWHSVSINSRGCCHGSKSYFRSISGCLDHTGDGKLAGSLSRFLMRRGFRITKWARSPVSGFNARRQKVTEQPREPGTLDSKDFLCVPCSSQQECIFGGHA